MTEKTGVEFKLFVLIAVIFVSVFHWFFFIFTQSDVVTPFNPRPVVLDQPKAEFVKGRMGFAFGLTVNEILYRGSCDRLDDENGNSYCEKKELWEDVIQVEGYIPFNPSWDSTKIIRDLVIQKIHYQDRLGQKHTLIISEQTQKSLEWSFRLDVYAIRGLILLNIFAILYLWYQYRKQKMIFNSLFKQGN